MGDVIRYAGANGAGDVRVSAANPLPVSGTISTTGLATSAKQDDLNALFGALNASAVTDPAAASAALLSLVRGLLTGINTVASAAADVTTPQPVYGSMKYVDVTLSTDTSAYGSGDLIADTQVVAACVRADDAFGVLASAVVIDEDDQGSAIDLWFLSANNTLGTENSAPSISDANAREILGYVAVAAADYKDLGGVKIASKTGINLPIKPATGTDDIYVAVVSNGSTPTYTASGLKLRLGFLS